MPQCVVCDRKFIELKMDNHLRVNSNQFCCGAARLDNELWFCNGSFLV